MHNMYRNDLDTVQHKFFKELAYISHCPIPRDSFSLIQDSIDKEFIRHNLTETSIMFVFDVINGFAICPEILFLIAVPLPVKILIFRLNLYT